MISTRVIQIFGRRVNLMKVLGNVFPAHWNWAASKIQVNNSYGQWNFKLFLIYITIYISLLVIRHAQRFALPQLNGKPLSDEADFTKGGESLNLLVIVIDIFYITAIWCLCCVSSVLVEHLESFVCFGNAILKTDKDLQG